MRRLIAPILLLAVACQSTASDPNAVRQAIEANNASIMRWYAAGQADSIAPLFAADAWQLPPNSPPVVGRDSIVAYWRNALAAGKWKFTLTTQAVVTTGAFAAERGTYSVAFEAGPKAPMPSFQDHGNYVVVWHQEADGKWRAVWDAPVSAVPMPPAAAH